MPRKESDLGGFGVYELPVCVVFGNSSAILEAMSVVEKRQELLENILRLRSAVRRSPDDRELAKVRLYLERELGETVSLRLAGRLLGVSHTALQRWIKSGDLPVVFTESGKGQVPVQALLTLYEATHSDDEAQRPRYVLTPTMTRQRQAAEQIRIPPLPGGFPQGHDRARARSLAYHRELAKRLRQPMVQEARHTLLRWREQGRIDPRYAERWEQLLDRPIHEIRRALVSEDQDSDDLRQNSPFAGMLSEPERRRTLQLG
jgi:hypothetical protein